MDITVLSSELLGSGVSLWPKVVANWMDSCFGKSSTLLVGAEIDNVADSDLQTIPRIASYSIFARKSPHSTVRFSNIFLKTERFVIPSLLILSMCRNSAEVLI